MTNLNNTPLVSYTKKVMFVEDNPNSRELILGTFDQAVKLGLIISPIDYLELESFIDRESFSAVISDFNLSEWTIKNEHLNGINVLERIHEKNETTELKIYSSNPGGISNKLYSSKISEHIKQIDFEETEDKLKVALEELINTNIKIKHKINLEYNNPIAVFLCNKIFNYNKNNDVFWKAGENIWHVFNGDTATNDNIKYKHEIEIKRDSESIKVKYISFKNQFKIDSDEIREKLERGNFDFLKKNDVLFEHLITKLVTQLFLDEEIKFKNYSAFLNQISDFSILESQKLLFIDFIEKANRRHFRPTNIKTEIEKKFKSFDQKFIYKIHDIYIGNVLKIEDDFAYLTLKNIASMDDTKSFKTPFKQLLELYLEEESEFYYTVYFSSKTLSLCTQIIPL